MKFTKYASFSAAIVFSLLTFFVGIFRGGLPGDFIIPYLVGAAASALPVAGLAWWFFLRNRDGSVGSYTTAAIVFHLAFAFAAGLFVVGAESIAEQEAIRIGRQSEESGYHNFYPNDSGMSELPTSWMRIPFVAGYLAVFWVPALYLITLLASRRSNSQRLTKSSPVYPPRPLPDRPHSHFFLRSIHAGEIAANGILNPPIPPSASW